MDDEDFKEKLKLSIKGYDFSELVAQLTGIKEVKNSILKKDSNMTNAFMAECSLEIHEGDPDWEPEFSGKVIYRRNSGDISPDVYDFVEGLEVPVDLSSVGDRPFMLYLYIPSGTVYTVRQELFTPSFPRKFDLPIEVFPLEECLVIKEPITVPVCMNMIPSKDSNDPALELYDYPFTILPLQDSCSSEKLGHSVKSVGACSYAREGSFGSCAAYQPFETIEIGITATGPVTLSREFIDYEIVNTYTYGEQVFRSYKELNEYMEKNSVTFELTWSPLAPPVPFFETIIGRLNTTYSKSTTKSQNVQIHNQKV